jgi:hypothetical protein
MINLLTRTLPQLVPADSLQIDLSSKLLFLNFVTLFFAKAQKVGKKAQIKSSA